jgi:hypothetical protein
MEAVPNFPVDLAWRVPVKASEGHAVVEFHSPVRHVQCGNRNRSTGSEEELTTTFCTVFEKVGLLTVMEYWPKGTARNVNSPSLPEVVVIDHSDDAAFSVTVAPWIGRCCESCTNPRTATKIVAETEDAIAMTAKSKRNLRDIIPPSP